MLEKQEGTGCEKIIGMIGQPVVRDGSFPFHHAQDRTDLFVHADGPGQEDLVGPAVSSPPGKSDPVPDFVPGTGHNQIRFNVSRNQVLDKLQVFGDIKGREKVHGAFFFPGVNLTSCCGWLFAYGLKFFSSSVTGTDVIFKGEFSLPVPFVLRLTNRFLSGKPESASSIPIRIVIAIFFVLYYEKKFHNYYICFSLFPAKRNRQIVKIPKILKCSVVKRS